MRERNTMLVDKASAISGRSWEQDRQFVMGLPKDHSNLVKFSERDDCYDRVCQYLKRLTKNADTIVQSRIVPTEYNRRHNDSESLLLHPICCIGFVIFVSSRTLVEHPPTRVSRYVKSLHCCYGGDFVFLFP